MIFWMSTYTPRVKMTRHDESSYTSQAGPFLWVQIPLLSPTLSWRILFRIPCSDPTPVSRSPTVRGWSETGTEADTDLPVKSTRSFLCPNFQKKFRNPFWPTKPPKKKGRSPKGLRKKENKLETPVWGIQVRGWVGMSLTGTR